jgi:hypothetical protein
MIIIILFDLFISHFIDQWFANIILNFGEIGFPHADLLVSEEFDLFQSLNIGIEVQHGDG